MKKEAFTLAETLIALAVLSVIFSLTVPYFVLAHHKNITAIKLKKSYSALSRTINLSQAYNSSISDWDTSLNGKEFFNKYFRSYLNVVNEYSSSQLKKIAPRKNVNGTSGSSAGAPAKVDTNSASSIFEITDSSVRELVPFKGPDPIIIDEPLHKQTKPESPFVWNERGPLYF